MRVLIVQNIQAEGPGLLLRFLALSGADVEVFVRPDAEPLPRPSHYDGVVLIGGPDSANDVGPRMEGLIEFARAAVAGGTPYLGICLGMQVLAKAAGARVVRAPRKEVGLVDARGAPYELILTEEGRASPLFEGLPDRFPVFQLHGETVLSGGAARVLAKGADGATQAIDVGSSAWGLQCHVEFDHELLETLISGDPDIAALCADVQGAGALRAAFEKAYPTLEALCATLAGNFARAISRCHAPRGRAISGGS
jgi:GMP synthase-like glutamine amidotransferase